MELKKISKDPGASKDCLAKMAKRRGSFWFLSQVLLLSPILWLYKTEVRATQEESLSGKNLRMAAEHWNPIFVISGEQGQVVYSGFMEKVLDYLRSALNFTTTVVRPPDKSWGSPNSIGHWSGMVGLVKRNEADFGLGK